MLTKWFFQHQFSVAPLLQLSAAAANLQYAHMGCCNKNTIVSFYAINPSFYKNGAWAQYKGETTPYLPYPGIFTHLYFWDTWDWPNDDLTGPTYTQFVNQHSIQVSTNTYADSVSYDKGFFSSRVISAKLITTELKKQTHIAQLPLIQCRYNPAKDTGVGNTIWLHSNITNDYSKPTRDKTLIIQGLPLWMLLYGWLSYVQQVRKAPDFFISYTLCMESPAIDISRTPEPVTTIIPIDLTFTQGKPPYGQDLSQYDTNHWYPSVYNQTEIINGIVTAGPYVPKYSQTRNSTWELHTFYEFFLSGEVQRSQNSQWQIQPSNPFMMPSINSMQQYKSGTQANKYLNPLYTPGTTDEESLKHQLLREYKTTCQLKALSKKIAHHTKKGKLQVPVLHCQNKNKKKSRAVSRSSAKKVPSKKKKHQTSSSSSSSKESNSSKSSTTSSSSSQS